MSRSIQGLPAGIQKGPGMNSVLLKASRMWRTPRYIHKLKEDIQERPKINRSHPEATRIYSWASRSTHSQRATSDVLKQKDCAKAARKTQTTKYLLAQVASQKLKLAKKNRKNELIFPVFLAACANFLQKKFDSACAKISVLQNSSILHVCKIPTLISLCTASPMVAVFMLCQSTGGGGGMWHQQSFWVR